MLRISKINFRALNVKSVARKHLYYIDFIEIVGNPCYEGEAKFADKIKSFLPSTKISTSLTIGDPYELYNLPLFNSFDVLGSRNNYEV